MAPNSFCITPRTISQTRSSFMHVGVYRHPQAMSSTAVRSADVQDRDGAPDAVAAAVAAAPMPTSTWALSDGGRAEAKPRERLRQVGPPEGIAKAVERPGGAEGFTALCQWADRGADLRRDRRAPRGSMGNPSRRGHPDRCMPPSSGAKARKHVPQRHERAGQAAEGDSARRPSTPPAWTGGVNFQRKPAVKAPATRFPPSGRRVRVSETGHLTADLARHRHATPNRRENDRHELPPGPVPSVVGG